jgi:uncharacterized protein with PQ loop repeat
MFLCLHLRCVLCRVMAVTFFLGRVPQVIKNWQRQSCAGLSMEMFAIVLTAAVTYCASILVRCGLGSSSSSSSSSSRSRQS